MILKIELIVYLYNLSESQVEVFVNENRPAKYFVGLAVDGKAPDHSTLTTFRERLLKNGKEKVFEEMLAQIVKEAMLRGVKFGSIQIIDSVHTIADVNTDKDQNRQRKGKGPHDPDAQWGVKHKHQVKNEKGEAVEQTEYFYGYKAHVSMNAESGLITSLETTSGEAYDGHHFCSRVDHDLAQGLPVDTYAADQGYADGDNHYHLELKKLHSAIHLKKTRTEKKDAHKQVCLVCIDLDICVHCTGKYWRCTFRKDWSFKFGNECNFDRFFSNLVVVSHQESLDQSLWTSLAKQG